MSIRSALAWFFRPDPNNAHIGPPGAQGMIRISTEPAKLNTVPRPERIRTDPMPTTSQAQAEIDALPPRTWRILCGTGLEVGTATEHPDTKLITVTWTVDPFPGTGNSTYRTQWVDEAAFLDDLHDNRYGRFPSNMRFVRPLRVRFIPRTDDERELERINAEDFDG